MSHTDRLDTGVLTAANTALLVAAEEGLRSRLLPRVDPYGARLESAGNALGALDILTPHTGAEAGKGAVGSLDNFLLIGPWLRWDDLGLDVRILVF